MHDGVGTVADGVGRVGGQDDVNGGSPQISMDGGGDPHMGADGGDGRQCKNLVILEASIFLFDEATSQAYCCRVQSMQFMGDGSVSSTACAEPNFLCYF
jgi:hypothetical protein